MTEGVFRHATRLADGHVWRTFSRNFISDCGEHWFSMADSGIMLALEQFDATEANLLKLERLWEELFALIPSGIAFGQNVEYEDRTRSFELLLASLPKIKDWKPTASPPDLDEVAQNRMDAIELAEPGVHSSVEQWIEQPGRELRDYRFRLTNMRKALIRDALIGLIDQIDADVRAVRHAAGDDPETGLRLDDDLWADMREHMTQIDVLLGSSVKRPPRWSDMRRHMRFGYVTDLNDIERVDWPDVKDALRKGLYGVNEAIPVETADLASLVAARPSGPIMTALTWSRLNDETFERLIFALISNTPGYENPEWLMQTRAPDKGRDLSVYRVSRDRLSGTLRQRVIIQCKHWLSRSIRLEDVSTIREQMTFWSTPRVDVLVFATSGRFTTDVVTWIERHNGEGVSPRIEMWPESHLELLLASRPAVIAEFGLRG